METSYEHSDDAVHRDVPSAPIAGRFAELLDDLRGVAGALFADQERSHTLQPTALINEAWLKLSDHLDEIQDRAHFFALAARVMRQILADHARAKTAQKRGGHAHKLTFVDGNIGKTDNAFDAIEFHDALERLSSLNQRHAEVVELRLLGMLTVPEIADLTGRSPNTVKRDWQAARVWLMRELRQA